MWKCQKCGEEVEESLAACWNCGTSKDGIEDPTFRRVDDPKFDHKEWVSPAPQDPAASRRKGIEYSRLADIALIVSTIATGFGCVAAVGAGVRALVQGDLLTGLVGSPIAFFLLLGLLVVFVRIQNV